MTNQLKTGEQKRPEPCEVVAVVGLGVSLPGAASPDELWSNIIEGRRFFQPATALDWGAEPELFLREDGPAPDKAYNLNGAFNHDRAIDPEGLNLPDDFDVKSADGSLAFWLAAGRKAKGEAKWQTVDPGRVGVISGHVILPTTAMAEAAVSLYARAASRDWPTPLRPDPPPKNAFRLLGYSARLLSQALGFSGPAYTLDAACASSLYAVHLAAEELLAGKLDAVISGGVAKADALFTQLGFSQLRALSASGAINAFDQSADGLVVGEGAAALVLKRLDRALADGDHIRAVIRGVGLSNDQTGNILAPQAEGQLRAMRAAWRKAGLKPSAAGLFEAHGTGTIIGDRVEVETLKELISDEEFSRPEKTSFTPVIGSVKSNIGHLLSAAGAAGLAKVILALEHKILPPTAGFSREAAGLNLAQPPALRVLTRPEPWPEPPAGEARLAAVNAFGFGGVNAQVIVEEWRPEIWPRTAAKNQTPFRAAKAAGQVRLLSARALSAPWPDFASLAQNWMESEGPPIISTRRFGHLKATGLFFNSLVLEGASLRLAPKDLAHILPQQALILKMADEALVDAKLDASPASPAIKGLSAGAPGAAPPEEPGVDKTRVGVFMGVDIDPRSADYAYRWLGPLRAAEALLADGVLSARDRDDFVAVLRRKSHPYLSASRVVGALGSLTASRVARFLGSGGPAFTVAEETLSGVRALKLAMDAIKRGDIDLAMVGMVDTTGDPKTAALEPRRLWEEGAVMLILASPEAARALGRGQAPEIAELPEADGRIGGLGGLFPLAKSAFYLSHHLISRGLGAGAAYWIKNRPDPPRRLESAGFALTEKGGEEVSSPPYSYDEATWFLVRSQNKADSLALLARLEQMAQAAMKNHALEGLGPARSEKRALKRLGDRFWAEYGKASGARPALAMLARTFDDLSSLIKKAREGLRGETTPDHRNLIIWARDGERVRGEMAWVFPGSGSQYQGLGRRLAMNFPHLMGRLEEGVERLADHFQSSIFWGQGHRDISPVQAILGQISFGLLGALVLKQFKLSPRAVIGYSMGEVTALAASGAWADREGLYEDLVSSPLFTRELAGEYRAARRFWGWPEDKPLKWLMGVTPRSAETVKKALKNLPAPHKGRAFLLSVNTGGESLIGGEEAAVRALSHALGSVLCQLESVAAVHNPTVQSVAAEYERFHTRVTTPPAGLRFYSAAWGRSYDLTAEAAARSLTDQAVYGHDFPKLIEQAYADGVRFFVEVGPGAATSRLISNILHDRPHLATSLSPNAHDEGWLGLNRLLVELWMAGWPLKMSVLYPDASGHALTLPVPIALAPSAETWPTPEKVLAQTREKTLEAESEDTPLPPPAVAQPRPGLGDPAWPGARGAPSAPREIQSPPAARPGPAPKAGQAVAGAGEARSPFDAWLAETREARRREQAALKADSPAPMNRRQCLEFAVGKIADVLGPRFAEVDSFPSRVRLPNEPLMFVDRVLSIEGQPLSMTSGRIVTEHDILPDAWYLDNGYMPAGLAIESGQADLMLSAWLGADFSTRGLALYRLLDAEVFFHRPFMPKAGETARYDIRIVRFFKYGQTHLFRFEFQGTIGGRPLLTMKGGCAGFFTPAELAGGRGLPGGGLLDEAQPAHVDPLLARGDRPMPSNLSQAALAALRAGDLNRAFGGFVASDLKNPLTIPGGRLALIDRVVKMEKNGGRYGAGFIRAEMDIDPGAWFLTSHFIGDEVMPGTLMFEGSLHTLRTFLLALGWVGESGEVNWQPVPGLAGGLKCRGQVTAATRTAAYEVHVRRLEFIRPEGGGEPEPAAVAEAVMLADDRPIVEVRNMSLRLAGLTRRAFLEKESPSRTAGRKAPAAAEGAGTELVFDKKKLLALAMGRPSEALGPAYARFDAGDFVARLPRPPYDFIDQATVTRGRPNEVRPGAEILAVYTPPAGSWVFTEAGGAADSLPYAALNETALQPCGFLAAFMGSALPFDGPMRFRNLGGRATVLAPVGPGASIRTTARLTRASRMGEMVIQHYEFSCSSGGRLVYEGLTHFGFFSPQGLAQQTGLRGENPAGGPAGLTPYPRGAAWPSGRWRMVDMVSVDPTGGGAGLGSALGLTAVDPGAWFFEAHFFQDPVWPGSLGLEAFLQTAKVLAWRLFAPDCPADAIKWTAPAPGRTHEWLYRGQVTRDKKEMAVSLQATSLDMETRTLVVDGLLSVDGLPIYKMTDFSATLDTAAAAQPRAVRAKPAASGGPGPDQPQISPDDILSWRRKRDVSQGQLAKLMGVTPIYISLMERGKRNISPLMAEKLAFIFAGGLSAAEEAADSEILARGTLKSRREEKEAAAKILTPEKLRELRLSRGFSQKKLADQVGVTATLIGLIELGKRGLSLELALKLLAALED